MANGDGGVLLQEHQSHGFAHNIAAAYDDSVFAFEGVTNALEHLHATVRGARPKAFHTCHQCASAGDVKSVYIFSGTDRFDNFLCVNMRR